jgi:hypothetical protein
VAEQQYYTIKFHFLHFIIFSLSINIICKDMLFSSLYRLKLKVLFFIIIIVIIIIIIIIDAEIALLSTSELVKVERSWLFLSAIMTSGKFKFKFLQQNFKNSLMNAKSIGCWHLKSLQLCCALSVGV